MDNPITAPTGRKLTVNQKALAEKTIKIKYNGLIESLKTTATRVEADNHPLPSYPSYLSPGQSYCEDGMYKMGGDEYSFPKDVQLSAEMADALNYLNETYSEYEHAKEALNRQIARENHKIQLENKERLKRSEAAKLAKGKVAQALASQRDDAILSVAFQGEDEEMLAILKAIPGPDAIMDQLKAAGFELAAPLPTITGIGSKSPKVLSGSAEVAIKITTDTE